MTTATDRVTLDPWQTDTATLTVEVKSAGETPSVGPGEAARATLLMQDDQRFTYEVSCDGPKDNDTLAFNLETATCSVFIRVDCLGSGVVGTGTGTGATTDPTSESTGSSASSTMDTSGDTDPTTAGTDGVDTEGGSTGDPPAMLEPGSYVGARFPDDIAVFRGAQGFTAMVTASGGGSFVDLATNLELEDMGLSQSAAVGYAGGAAAAFVGFPGARFSQSDDAGWGPLTPVGGFIGASALTTAAAATDAQDVNVCGATDSGVIACVEPSGKSWTEVAGSRTDNTWVDSCVSFTTEALAVNGDWVLLLTGGGDLCHGQLGTGTQGTAVDVGLTFDAVDLECPADSAGNSTTCAGLDQDGTFRTISWSAPGTAPVAVETVATCGSARTMGSLVTSDDAEAWFVTACGDTSHLVKVDTSDQSVISNTSLPLPATCAAGDTATFVDETLAAIGCNGTIEIVDLADYA